MIYLTRRERFNAAHRLFREDWSDEENYKVFGKCSNPNWHGHNYILFVTVRGEVDPGTGFVINLKQLSDIVNVKIIDKVDHKNLNLEVDFMKGLIPSTENLAMAIWKELEGEVSVLNAELDSIKIYETENNFVEYKG